MVFYSDDQCTQWEGLKGVTSGEHTFDLKTDESVACVDALACVFHPQGDKCKTLQTVASTTRILSQVENGVTEMCDEAGVCEPVDETACQKSEILPSCYYRMTSAEKLVSDPSSYVTKGVNATTAAPTAAPSDPKDPSAAPMVSLFAAMLSLVGLSVISVM